MQTYDFGEIFTNCARHVLRQTLMRGQSFSFDCEGPPLLLDDDPLSVECAIYRLMCAVTEILPNAFLVLKGRTADLGGGRAEVHVLIGGLAAQVPAETVARVLERLQLPDAGRPWNDSTPARTARGRCPISGASVAFGCTRGRGVLFAFTLQCHGQFDPAPLPDAAGATVWVVSTARHATDCLSRRLHRAGWSVVRFDTCEDAAQYAARLQGGEVRPAWVVVLDSPDITEASLDTLSRALPRSCTRSFAVPAGAPALLSTEPVGGFEVELYPFSPAQIHHVTTAARGRDGAPSTWLLPEPPRDSRSPLLVVDDNEVNRMVASEMARMLGYSVVTADDGLAAIQQCNDSHPQAVLMDLDMPRLNGIDATQQLRALQRDGRMPPFAVVALTAGLQAQVGDQCRDAGMDGYLSKPLSFPELAAELHRVVVPAVSTPLHLDPGR
ncbi:response regulator [Caldimonas brevitalea]|nr:response regulator [Caldimonas brevitalea]